MDWSTIHPLLTTKPISERGKWLIEIMEKARKEVESWPQWKQKAMKDWFDRGRVR